MENSQRVIVENVAPETNGLAVAAMVLGILAVVLNIIPIFPYPLAILAIIFGIIGRGKSVKQGMALSGIILGGIGLLMKIGFWLFVILLGSAQ